MVADCSARSEYAIVWCGRVEHRARPNGRIRLRVRARARDGPTPSPSTSTTKRARAGELEAGDSKGVLRVCSNLDCARLGAGDGFCAGSCRFQCEDRVGRTDGRVLRDFARVWRSHRVADLYYPRRGHALALVGLCSPLRHARVRSTKRPCLPREPDYESRLPCLCLSLGMLACSTPAVPTTSIRVAAPPTTTPQTRTDGSERNVVAHRQPRVGDWRPDAERRRHAHAEEVARESLGGEWRACTSCRTLVMPGRRCADMVLAGDDGIAVALAHRLNGYTLASIDPA